MNCSLLIAHCSLPKDPLLAGILFKKATREIRLCERRRPETGIGQAMDGGRMMVGCGQCGPYGGTQG